MHGLQKCPPERSQERRKCFWERAFAGTSPHGSPTRPAVGGSAGHATYIATLTTAPVSAETRRTYASKVRGYLAWLDTANLAGDPLTEPNVRDQAAHDYRTHLLTVAGQAPTTVNNALAAVDDFYTRRGLGPAKAARANQPVTIPRAWTPARNCAGCAPSTSTPRLAIGSWPSCRFTPESGSPKW